MGAPGGIDRRGFLKSMGAVAAAAAGPHVALGPDAPRNPGASPGARPITADLATWASGLKFEDLSREAVHQAKRFLLDSVGCALAGHREREIGIALDVLGEVAAPGPATIIGTGQALDVVSASLANALMVRCTEYNDVYWKQDPSHPSDLIPVTLACAERMRSGGREAIVGIALGYELECRMCEAAVPGIRERGWHHATLTGFVSPVVAGRMLHLPWDRIQHAVGISASARCTLGAVAAGRLTMMKNAADPLACQSGVLAALLASKGYTGPEHVLDGKEGLVQCLGPRWTLDVLTAGLGRSWRITDCAMKLFPTETLTHTPISAVLEIVGRNDLRPEQVAAVRVGTTARAADILGDPSKYDPRTREAAGHSLPYCIATAIVHRRVTPAEFTAAALGDPVIRALLPKVKVTVDPDAERVFPALQRATVRVETVDGRVLSSTLDHPKGDARNPLTDQEIETKFASLAEGVLGDARRRRVMAMVWDLENVLTVSALMKELVADVAHPR